MDYAAQVAALRTEAACESTDEYLIWLEKRVLGAQKMDLIKLPIAEARAMKNEVGRQKYGGEQFVGDPLEKLHESLIDAMNYEDECKRRGYEIAGAMSVLEILCLRVMAIHHTSHEEV